MLAHNRAPRESNRLNARSRASFRGSSSSRTAGRREIVSRWKRRKETNIEQQENPAATTSLEN